MFQANFLKFQEAQPLINFFEKAALFEIMYKMRQGFTRHRWEYNTAHQFACCIKSPQAQTQNI